MMVEDVSEMILKIAFRPIAAKSVACTTCKKVSNSLPVS